METRDRDWRESDERVEEKLARADWRDRLFAAERAVANGERYRDVGDYDAVLKSHCRL